MFRKPRKHCDAIVKMIKCITKYIKFYKIIMECINKITYIICYKW